MAKNAPLDDFDQALLREVQKNNLTPARVLAKRVGLSESAVLRRLRRLRTEQVITADISVVSPETLGVPVSVHVLVSLKHGSRTYGDFSRKLRKLPEVKQASYVTGDADFILHLQLESMAAYAAFAQDNFHQDPNVSEYHTYVAMQEVVGPGAKR